MHDITRTRLHETYKMLAHRLAAHNFILATTKWNEPEKDAERKRERQLSEKFWKGSNVPRFMHTTESAWEIVDLMLQMPPLDTPQFRKTLKSRPQTGHATPSRYLSRFLRRLFDQVSYHIYTSFSLAFSRIRLHQRNTVAPICHSQSYRACAKP